MKTHQLLLFALCAITLSQINANPLSIKNDTTYSLKVIVNGVTAEPYTLKPGEVKSLYRWGGRTALEHNDFNRIQIQNWNLEKVAPITELSTEQFKADINGQPAFLEAGRKPCVIIKAGYTSWYLESGWACTSTIQ
jgi:hypothetical protein